MSQIEWDDFHKVDIRVGTITEGHDFPEARKSAFKLVVDFGQEMGTRKSSAQITDLYDRDSLLGKQVIAVINFHPRQIGPVMSECLVTGFHDQNGSVILAVPDAHVPEGTRLCCPPPCGKINTLLTGEQDESPLHNSRMQAFFQGWRSGRRGRGTAPCT